jgi:hypothetical protein
LLVVIASDSEASQFLCRSVWIASSLPANACDHGAESSARKPSR